MSTSAARVCIVTGGTKGIGRAIALRLVEDGFAVVLNYAGDEKAAQDTLAQIAKCKGRARAVRGDVARAETFTQLFDTAEAKFGQVYALINNAGVLHNAPLVKATDEWFDKQVGVNFKGAFNGLRTAAARIVDGGRIISMSTSVVGTNLPSYGVYAATKAAVETMTRILAKELGARGVTVNAIAPGPVATDLFLQGKSKTLIDDITSKIPMGRLGTPEDIARVTAFLVSEDGGWVNGQILRANGGLV